MGGISISLTVSRREDDWEAIFRVRAKVKLEGADIMVGKLGWVSLARYGVAA